LRRTMHVAVREFLATVMTKGFILGVLMTPVLLLVVVGGMMLLRSQGGPRAAGSVAVIDRSGLVAPEVLRRFGGEATEAQRRRDAEELERASGEAARRIGLDEEQAALAKNAAARAAADHARGADLSVEVLPPQADPEEEKQRLAPPAQRGEGGRPRLAVAVFPEALLRPGAGGDYPGFELFMAPKVDFEIEGQITRRLSEAVVDARLGHDERVRAGGLTPGDVRRLLAHPEVKARAVTAAGEKETSELASFVIPMGFMLLLLISVMTAGQYLLTTTIEEKGSRVMEVLLSAISPLQLMVGKVLGQMAVGLVILVVYSGLAIAALLGFSMKHLVDPMHVVYLITFFLIAFFLVASFMAGIGSAVTELREAQTLMAPVMAIMIVPWLLWMPIQRAPNSVLATTLSFVPGLNPFVMVIRIAGSEPIPAWQIPVSILVGVLTAAASAWAAAKIFRVGVLMYGKPPDFRTLARWIRMA